jgi:NAD(P)-dependent dehydrogenase (short-subunit alcohol dehydrogenase family)
MGQTALIIGASGGIGQALISELENRAYVVTSLSRRVDGLDITSEDNVAAKLNTLENQFDLIIIATGALSRSSGPEKSLKALSGEEMAAMFAINTIGPALVLKHAVSLLPKNRRAVLAILSARVGSIGDNHLGGWYSYRTSKAALNQIIRTASIELKRTHKHLVCAALHPGTVTTDFTKVYPNHTSVSPQTTAENLINVLEQLSPTDTGGFFDWAGKQVPW